MAAALKAELDRTSKQEAASSKQEAAARMGVSVEQLSRMDRMAASGPTDEILRRMGRMAASGPSDARLTAAADHQKKRATQEDNSLNPSADDLSEFTYPDLEIRLRRSGHTPESIEKIIASRRKKAKRIFELL